MTLNFPSCDDAILSYASTTGFGSGTIPLVRLSSLVQVRCENPPSKPVLTTGTWTGAGICFNVAPDGNTLIEITGECDGKALDSSVDDAETPAGERCDAKADCRGPVAIVNGQFSCIGEANNEVVVGAFVSATEASGLSQESEAFDSVCTGSWTATPR